MIKLYQLKTKSNSTYYCFAHNSKQAKQIVIKEILNGKVEPIAAFDITDQKISQDGVQYLINNSFIGVPKRKMFMLHGCESARQNHYKNKTSELWWSDAVPGSEELWK